MNAKIVAALSFMVALVSLGSPVRAQSSEISNSNPDDYKLTGDSLEGIDTRTAQDDFQQFFDVQNSQSPSGRFGLSETISLPRNPIFLQPAQSVDSNDGVQVQLDLGNE
ncbi:MULTISPECIES: hypothetical protein [unclassified Anabaena]|uniref:hypothetical protein n=1 Tax=unclassified Anabaena TaxID=2619674 RepID=UPI0039C5E3E8